MKGSNISKFLNELKAQEYNYRSIHEIYKEKELNQKVVELILKWLPSVYEEDLGSGDQLVRSLISASKPYDPTVLIDLFENSSFNKTIKWGIAYVLSVSKTYDISDWIKDQLLNRESSFERDGLIEGLVKKGGIKDRIELMSILKELFDKYCYFEGFMKLFMKYGGKDDVSFLQERLQNPNMTHYLKFMQNADVVLNTNRSKHASAIFQREMMKIINGIEKRKREYPLPSLP